MAFSSSGRFVSIVRTVPGEVDPAGWVSDGVEVTPLVVLFTAWAPTPGTTPSQAQVSINTGSARLILMILIIAHPWSDTGSWIMADKDILTAIIMPNRDLSRILTYNGHCE